MTEQLLVETTHAIVAHLEQCPTCRAEIEGLRRLRASTRTAFNAAAELQVRPEFVARLSSQLQVTAAAPRTVVAPRPRWLALAAGLMLLVGSGLASACGRRPTSASCCGWRLAIIGSVRSTSSLPSVPSHSRTRPSAMVRSIVRSNWSSCDQSAAGRNTGRARATLMHFPGTAFYSHCDALQGSDSVVAGHGRWPVEREPLGGRASVRRHHIASEPSRRHARHRIPPVAPLGVRRLGAW